MEDAVQAWSAGAVELVGFMARGYAKPIARVLDAGDPIAATSLLAADLGGEVQSSGDPTRKVLDHLNRGR
jgi:hypothetical protein